MNFTSNPKPGYPSFALDGLRYNFKEYSVVTQCTDESRHIISNYANNITNGIIVEIGVLGGATLLSLIDLAQKNNNIIYGIDPFEKINIFNGVDENDTDPNMVQNARAFFKNNRLILQKIIKEYNLDNNLKILHDNSASVVDTFADKSINLLHIDGDHSTLGVYEDLTKYYPKMAKGGVIIGDDFKWISVKNGLDMFCKDTNQIYVGIGDKYIIVFE